MKFQDKPLHRILCFKRWRETRLNLTMEHTLPDTNCHLFHQSQKSLSMPLCVSALTKVAVTPWHNPGHSQCLAAWDSLCGGQLRSDRPSEPVWLPRCLQPPAGVPEHLAMMTIGQQHEVGHRVKESILKYTGVHTTRTHAYAETHTQIHTHTHTHTHMHTHTQMHTHTYTHKHIHMHTHTHIYTNTHTHTHTHSTHSLTNTTTNTCVHVCRHT